ncbi:uncharacterized protein [Procambarus clarkii]|uniref:uncharacterized protein n=1 Tax=Procambarus clarkii TaxID=6728 RepID=UPI003743C1DE
MALTKPKSTGSAPEEISSNCLLYFRSYTSHKSHVTRQLNKCDQLVQSGATSKVLENLIETAKQQLQRTNETADDYLRVLMQQNAEPDQLDTFHAEMEKFEEGTQDHLNRLTQSLEKLQSNSVSQNTLTTSETNKSETLQEVRLPTIDLPHFHGGDDENFESYWKTFDSLVNSKKSISKPNKFLYLQSTLEGEAKAVVEHLGP